MADEEEFGARTGQFLLDRVDFKDGLLHLLAFGPARPPSEVISSGYERQRPNELLTYKGEKPKVMKVFEPVMIDMGYRCRETDSPDEDHSRIVDMVTRDVVGLHRFIEGYACSQGPAPNAVSLRHLSDAPSPTEVHPTLRKMSYLVAFYEIGLEESSGDETE